MEPSGEYSRALYLKTLYIQFIVLQPSLSKIKGDLGRTLIGFMGSSFSLSMQYSSVYISNQKMFFKCMVQSSKCETDAPSLRTSQVKLNDAAFYKTHVYHLYFC